MQAVVVYESVYGNTHVVAEAIGNGLRETAEMDVAVVAVDHATEELLADAELVIVGGPTHGHGMSHVSTRKAAIDTAAKPGSGLAVDPDAEGLGLRDWFKTVRRGSARAAAFDTRFELPAPVTGRASKGIARKLRQHGFTLITEPQSFYVTKENQLEPDQEAHAPEWGANLVVTLHELGPYPTASAR